MKWLFLDESGDLGFDFTGKKPSRYFTICVLEVDSKDSIIRLRKAVEKTLKNKLRKREKDTSYILKGSKTEISVKKYFYRIVQDLNFKIYSVTLNKERVFRSLLENKGRVYNWISRLVLEKIPIESSSTRIRFVLDKSKSKREIEDFNQYIINQLMARVDPNIPLDIRHLTDNVEKILQAVDLFTWGIFRKYEKGDFEWYTVFRSKIEFDTLYLP